MTCNHASRLLRSFRGLAVMAMLGLPFSTAAQGTSPSTAAPAPQTPRTDLTTDQAVLYPRAHDAVLGSGDLIRISVFGQIDYTPSVRIGVDGDVLLPLIGLVHLSGLTITGAEEYLAQKLSAAGMYRNPQVSVQLVEGPNAVLTFSGEMHQVVPVAGTRRLVDVISAAGGLPATASHVVTINRPGAANPIIVDLGSDPLHSEFANIPVFAGDTIVTSRLGVVYMVGAFKTTGVLPLTPYSPLTLIQATTLSGGVMFEGKFDDLRIIRTVGDRRTIVKLDIKRVLYGKAPDPILQSGDIVFLPNSAVKASLSNGTLGTVLGLSGIFISLAR